MKLFSCLLIVLWSFGIGFAEFSDLENFVRVTGSLNSSEDVVDYFNGSVWGKQPGKNLVKLFNFEGYNINRKIRQQDGSFLSLSREFVVYRQPNTSQILQVWMNPWTNKPNEVFSVANDPVNGKLNGSSPSQFAPHAPYLYLVYNSDIVLEYPNPLSPDKYANYSAGPIYDSVELFGFFGNYSQLMMTQKPSVPFAGTWVRKSQYLPWMEMSTTPGSLYYTTLAWKCSDGLSCVADDIMKIVHENYPKFEQAPSTYEVPNETSWTVFKKVIDQRRQVGLHDIIIPQVNVSSNVHTMSNNVDSRVEDILDVFPISLNINGSAWSEIVGKQSVKFFDLHGFFQFDLERAPLEGGYRVQLDGFLTYLDPQTGRSIRNFINPITGQNVTIPSPEIGLDFIFKSDSFYTIDIPSAEAVGLIGAQSTEGNSKNDDNWSVNFINFLFPYSELAKQPTAAHFAGTLASFSCWPSWLQMAGVPGNMVYKLTVSK